MSQSFNIYIPLTCVYWYYPDYHTVPPSLYNFHCTSLLFSIVYSIALSNALLQHVKITHKADKYNFYKYVQCRLYSINHLTNLVKLPLLSLLAIASTTNAWVVYCRMQFQEVLPEVSYPFFINHAVAACASSGCVFDNINENKLLTCRNCPRYISGRIFPTQIGDSTVRTRCLASQSYYYF